MLILGFALGAGPQLSLPQTYPSRPVRVIVPFGAGGTPDAVARILSDKFAGRVGQPLIVENRPGGDSIIGFDAVAKAAPNGHTILFNTNAGITLLPHTRKSLPFDPLKDFVHVAQIAYFQYVFAANPSLPATNMAEVAPLSTKRKLSYGSSSEGQYVTGAMWRLATGADVLHVPYKTAAQATMDLLSGRVDMQVATPITLIPHFKSGKLKPLAVSGVKRAPILPDVPTMQESGFRDFESSFVYGFSAPTGTPSTIVKRLETETLALLEIPEVSEKLIALGAEPRPGTGEQFAAILRSDSEKWRDVLKRVGFKPE
jgi:tripartite-type tricarboxylate transporter receptor subunit TctC